MTDVANQETPHKDRAVVGAANQDTPHKDRTVVGTGPHTATARHSLRKPTLQEFRQRLIQEMTNRSVPLSLQDFLDTFLPVPHNQKPRRATATLVKKFSVLKDVKTKDWKEDDIAKTFVSSRAVLERYGPGD